MTPHAHHSDQTAAPEDASRDFVGSEYFRLPPARSGKDLERLIGADARRFAAVRQALQRNVVATEQRLATTLATPAGSGQSAAQRDGEVRSLAGRKRVLQRSGSDLCLGRITPIGNGEPVYVGRLGLADEHGTRLLADWRTPAAAPFFAATLADPQGVAVRRRYRWLRGQVVDYWDEVLDLSSAPVDVAPDDDSAFLLSLDASRTDRMQDVLSTLQTDQDAIIRADSHGPLVVDGGPGTGKTVVALHRAAYLLHADPRLSRRDGNILFIGPHEPYLAYVADVLPNLGEDGVQTCTVADLVPESATAIEEHDPAVARLKNSSGMLEVIDAAVDRYEVPPTTPLTIDTPAGEIEVTEAHWRAAFDSADSLPHNDARDKVWAALLDLVVEQGDDENGPERLRRHLAADEDLRNAFQQAWPVLDPVGVVADLWQNRHLLASCAPRLSDHDLASLHRPDALAWTTADLPLLDAARARIGEPETLRQRRLHATAAARELERRNRVVDDLIAADDDGTGIVTMLRGQDAQNSLRDEAALPARSADRLTGPYAHVVIDEAQELTDAQWQMVLRRCPSRSLTIVGDRAQARHGFTETWEQRLARVGLPDVRRHILTINYRTPAEVMVEAEHTIRAAIPDANVPTSIRSTGLPVQHLRTDELKATLNDWLHGSSDGIACVIGAPAPVADRRIRALDPQQVKGLEFDLVALVDPDQYGTSITGAVDRYVAMTRSTRHLLITTTP